MANHENTNCFPKFSKQGAKIECDPTVHEYLNMKKIKYE